jgi:hypothetical protein
VEKAATASPLTTTTTLLTTTVSRGERAKGRQAGRRSRNGKEGRAAWKAVASHAFPGLQINKFSQNKETRRKIFLLLHGDE